MFRLLPPFLCRHFFHISSLTFIVALWTFSGFDSYANSFKVYPETEFQSISGVPATSLPLVSPKIFTSPSAPPSVSPSPITIAGSGARISKADKTVNLTGEVISFRGQNGRGSLSSPDLICDFARERLLELATNYSHDGFSEMREKTGKGNVAENIAGTSSDRGAHFVVFEMWAKSEGHKKNMLGDYTEGCGYYDGRYGVLILAK